MNFEDSWKAGFENELTQAQSAREAGNEGRARVCARRAAGIVIGEYLRRTGQPSPGTSALDRLRYLANLEDESDEIREIAGHFLVRIGADWNLPIQADLIADARWLAEALLS